MKRPVVLAVAATALVAAAVFVWLEVRREREFRRLVAVGDAALASDRMFEAIEAFSGAAALKPSAMLPYLKRGDTYRRQGQFSAALRDLVQANALDLTAPRAIELLGDVNDALGRRDRAVEHYQRYLALDDRAPRVLYKLALAQYGRGRSESALEPLRKALAMDGRFAEAHYLLGLALRAANRLPEARRALGRAVELNAAFTAAREELADLAEETGRRRERIEQLEAIAALEPERPERLVDVALAYASMGRHEAAVVTLDRAAERYPDSPEVRSTLGRVWLEVAESTHDQAALAKALAALQDIAARSDASSATQTLYGRALFIAGRRVAAERMLQSATARLPVEPLSFRYLSEAATSLGHVDVARQAARRYEALAGL